MLFSKSFIVPGPTFRSLIYFELIFIYVVRKCSNFILVHITVQFSQYHILKKVSFPHCIFFLSKGVWVYLWTFYLVPLVCVSVFVPVPYCLDACIFVVLSEVRKVDSSICILLSQDCFAYLESFVFSYVLWNCLF